MTAATADGLRFTVAAAGPPSLPPPHLFSSLSSSLGAWQESATANTLSTEWR